MLRDYLRAGFEKGNDFRSRQVGPGERQVDGLQACFFALFRYERGAQIPLEEQGQILVNLLKPAGVEGSSQLPQPSRIPAAFGERPNFR